MMTSRNNRFLKGGLYRLLITAAILCGASAARAALPSGYAELEYIESTGTQYIDTGVVITPTMAVEADAQFTEIVKQARIFGNAHDSRYPDGITGDGYLNFAVYINGAGNGDWASAMKDSDGDWVTSGVAADRERHVHKLDCTTKRYYLDGTAKGNAHSTVNKSTNGSIFLFANHCDPVGGYAKMRLYSCKIYDSGEVVHDYVPTRRLSDFVLGLYDLETGIFLVNAGADEFVPGRRVLRPPVWPGDKPGTNGFERTMEISIGEDMVPAANVFTNFQVLVRLSETRQNKFHYADCAENGADIRFTMPDGSLLVHEIDTWNTSGDSLVWVNISNLTAATKFRMYWKPRQGVELPVVEPALTWPKYAGVWHFNDAYPTNAADSSENHYDGMCVSNVTVQSDGSLVYDGVCNPGDVTQVDGMVGKTFHINITNTLFTTGVTDSRLYGIDSASSFTISGWIKADSAQCGNPRLAAKGGYWVDGWRVGFSGDAGTTFTFCSGGAKQTRNFTCDCIYPDWQYFTAIYAGGKVRLFQNGVSKGGDQTLGASDGNAELYFYMNLVGSGDELRIRNGATSAEHALADYKTQTDADFLSYGPVENQGGVGLVIYVR